MARTLVIASSGKVGSEVAHLLREVGHSPRTTTSRHPTEPDQVHLDLLTGQGLAEAFDGVEKAFLVAPSGYADAFRILEPLIDEARRRSLRKVVLMTALGVENLDTAPLRRAERALEKSGLAFNIVRPNWFMQNFNTFWIHDIRNLGKIRLPAHDARVSFIDTRDIAACVVKLLGSDALSNRAFTLTGAEAVSHTEVADHLTRATGKKITYEEISPAELRSSLLSAGLPSDYTDLLLLLMGFLAEGHNATVTADAKTILGREPNRFEKYAHDFRSSWL